MDIYFDNSATTRPYREVCEKMAEIAYEVYGNPSSLHTKGMEAEHVLKDTRAVVADKIGCRSDEVFFTSGGTENANTAIFGAVSASRKKHIITTKGEHPCVLEPIKKLEKEGYRVTYLSLDKNGFVDEDQLSESVCEDTALVCMMHVNNEVGAITNLERMGKIIRKNPQTLFFADCVQSFCKIPVSAAWCDMISISGHKIHGPKGVGALYVKKGVRLHPRAFGGGQEKNMRPGTENVPAIAGLGCAVSMNSGFDDKGVKRYMADRILSEIPDCFINNIDFENSADYILNMSFLGARSEVILHFLESRGVFVSSGSACSSNKPGKSHVLTAMGLENKLVDSSIRFSFCNDNTIEEADRAVYILKEILPGIRR